MFKLQDAKYAAKVILSVRSGYLFLEYNSREEWRPIGYTMEVLDFNGGWRRHPNFNLENDPYYTCARFGNGRHIPLPLILGDDGDAGPLQRLALRIVSKFSKSMRDAEFDCAHYDNQWRDDYAQYAENQASELEQQLTTDLSEFELANLALDVLESEAAQLAKDLQESADFPPSPDFPGEIESSQLEHCSAESGCDGCEYESAPDCPGMN